jgi:hypothetical protein
MLQGGNMAIQNISGVDSIPKGFEVNTANALEQENGNNISQQIKEDVNSVKEDQKGTIIDTTA